MNTNHATNGTASPRFRVGDWIAFTTGLSRRVAEVIEDCGPVGQSGTRYYRLREPIWYAVPAEYEMPETSLVLATYAEKQHRDPPTRPYPDPYDTWDEPISDHR